MAESNPHACGFPDEPCSTCEAQPDYDAPAVDDAAVQAVLDAHDVGPGDADAREPVAGADSSDADASDGRTRLVELRISPRYRCCYKNGCGPNCW